MRARGAWTVAACLAPASLGCSGLLDIPAEVDVLCETGAECPSGFCGADFVCDDRQWVVKWSTGGRVVVTDAAFFDPDGVGPAPGVVVAIGEHDGRLELGAGHVLEASEGLDGFVVALDEHGHVRWSRALGGPGDQRPSALAIDGDGGVVVAGTFAPSLEVGALTIDAPTAPAHAFLVALDAGGEPSWAVTAASGDALTVRDVVLWRGSAAVIGTYRGTLAESPPIRSGELEHTFSVSVAGGDRIVELVAGGGNVVACCAHADPVTQLVHLAGSYDGTLYVGEARGCPSGVCTSAGARDVFLLTTGVAVPTFVSVQPLPQDDFFDALVTDSNGQLLEAIRTSTEGMLVGRATAGGSLTILRLEPEATADLEAYGVRSIASAGLESLVLGWFTRSLEVPESGIACASADQDLFVLGIDASWSPVAARSLCIGGAGRATPAAIDVDREGRAIVAASFDGTVALEARFGGRSLVATGATDSFVARFALE
jgi:hypothetical protein